MIPARWLVVTVATVTIVVAGCSSASTSQTDSTVVTPSSVDPDSSTSTTPVASSVPTTVPASTTSTAPAPMPNPRLVDLEDTRRPVVTNGRSVAPTRRLPTLVWSPPGGGDHPLVVFAHGYSVGPLTYARFCAAIAAAGYVVAAPSFPLADAGRGLGLDRGDLPNEATDVSFVISALRSGSYASAISAGAVGVVGHSDGADVALEVGYQSGLADRSVGAVVAIAPDAFAGTLASPPRPPLLLVHADSDPVVPHAESEQVFSVIPTPRSFVTLLGADHLPPVAESTRWTPIVDSATVAFLDATLRRTITIDAARQGMAVPGLSTLRIAG